MCIFVTAIVPSESVSATLEKACEKYGFSVQQTENKSLATFFDGFQFLPIGGMCNCSTALGALERANSGESVDLEAEVRKLKHKGWGASKIERWKAEKERLAYRREHETNTTIDEELAKWTGFIEEVLSAKLVSRFGLIVHSYRGSIDSEKIPVKGIETIPLNELNRDRLAHLSHDVVYEFVDTH